jgi:hypothetical protein
MITQAERDAAIWVYARTSQPISGPSTLAEKAEFKTATRAEDERCANARDWQLSW